VSEWILLRGHVNDHIGDATIRMSFAENERGRVELWKVEMAAGSTPLDAEAIRRLALGKYVAWLNGGAEKRERALQVLRGGGTFNLVPGPRRPPLRVAGASASSKPDGFYENVAELYYWLTSDGDRGAAKRIAQANRVPATTVHAWIKEARRRGLLAPGRRGRAG
jgi:hypothetical protein